MLELVHLHPECIPCIIRVRFNELEEIIRTNRSVEYLGIILREFSNYILNNEVNVTRIATNLFRIVKKLTNNKDPYRHIKHSANTEGLKLYKKLKSIIEKEESDLKLELAVKASLIGNALDLGVADYRPPRLEELILTLHSMKIRGAENIKVLKNVKSKTILYLLDNAGEAALDKLLAEELRRRGASVIGVVKSGSFQNDVTIREVDELGLRDSFSHIVETGTDASSIFLDEISEELKEILRETDIIIAKGMAHYEYLTDVENLLNKSILYLLRAKCKPVAKELGVNIGDFIVHLYKARI